MPRVFISYRHADSQAATAFLHDRLEKEFGKRQVFMDTSDIRPGEVFPQSIQHFIATAHVMLIVIGPRWLSTCDRDGHRRLDNPNDLLRQEIEWGLEAGIQIIPILVDGVSMPQVDELPEALWPLAERSAFKFPGQLSVDESVRQLVRRIWASSGRRPIVRRPRLLLFHSAVFITLASVVLCLAVQAGLMTLNFPIVKQLSTLVAPPQAPPRIVSFQADSLTVVQDAPLTVRWAVEDAHTCALYVDDIQYDLLPAEESQATLMLDTPGPHELALVASRGELSTRATLQVQVDAPLQIRRFAASPSVLTRYIARDVELTWDVAGAEQVRLEDLGALTGQVALSTFPPQGSAIVRLRLEEQTVITLVAIPASGQPQRQPLLLRVEDPYCLVSADQGPVYDSPGGSGAPLDWHPQGDMIFPDRRNEDGTWLRIHATGGQHVWMPTPVLDCRTFAPIELLVAEE